MNKTGKCFGCGKPSTGDYCSNQCVQANRKDRNCALCAPSVLERNRAANICRKCLATKPGADVWFGPKQEPAEWYGPGPMPRRASSSRIAVKVGGGKWRQRDTSGGTRSTTQSNDASEKLRRRILQLFINRQRRDVPYFDRKGRRRGTRTRWAWLSQREIAALVGVDESYVSQVVAGINRGDGGIVARIIVDISKQTNGNLEKVSREKLERSLARVKGQQKRTAQAERGSDEHPEEDQQQQQEQDEDGPIEPAHNFVEPN